MTERKLAVILHADVVGSTALVQRDETRAHERIRDSFRRFAEVIAEHNGSAREVRGDAIVAEFARASDALGAALGFQQANAEALDAKADDMRPVLRVGIAMGEVVIADDTVTGEGVVLAQRLEQLAAPGGTCLQGAAYDTVPKRLPFHYRSLGEQSLKGFDDTVRVYAVTPASEDGDANGTTPDDPIEPVDRPAIAVLPFANMSGDPEQEHFSNGITEDIITALSRIAGLSVIARNTIMVYKDRAVDVKQVGQDLNVQYVLEGSVRKAANRVRVTAQLIDATSGHHRWADRYDRDLDDIFAVQDDITHNITVEMRVQLSIGEKARMLAGRTRNVSAWEKQLRADELNNNFVRADNHKARQLCEEALALDPDYVSAWTELGWTHFEDAMCGWSESAQDSLDETEKAIDKALTLEPDYPFALSLLGYLLALRDDFQRSIDVSEKAVRLAPDNAEGVAELAHMLLFAGRTDEALPIVQEAIRLCPTRIMWHLTILGQCQQTAGQLALAIDTLREAVHKGPGSPYPRLCLVDALVEADALDEARQVASEIQQLERQFSVSRWHGAHFRDRARRQGSIERLLQAGLAP